MDFEPEKRKFILDIDPTKSYSWLFIGSTRSGKTTLMKHVIDRYFQRKINMLMTESPGAEIYSHPEFKSCIICPDFSPKMIRRAWKINKNTDCHYEFNFILDDCINGKFNKELKRALTIYRNSGISVAISSQSLTLALPKDSRSNVNFVFLGRANNDELARDIIKAYLSSFFPTEMKMDDRIKKYKELTKNNHFIFCNNLTDEMYIIKIDKI
jgi:hypothetical protein